MMHPYEQVAWKALRKIEKESVHWQSSRMLRLTPEERQDCVSYAVTKICIAAHKKPESRAWEWYQYNEYF